MTAQLSQYGIFKIHKNELPIGRTWYFYVSSLRVLQDYSYLMTASHFSCCYDAFNCEASWCFMPKIPYTFLHTIDLPTFKNSVTKIIHTNYHLLLFCLKWKPSNNSHPYNRKVSDKLGDVRKAQSATVSGTKQKTHRYCIPGSFVDAASSVLCTLHQARCQSVFHSVDWD